MLSESDRVIIREVTDDVMLEAPKRLADLLLYPDELRKLVAGLRSDIEMTAARAAIAKRCADALLQEGFIIDTDEDESAEARVLYNLNSDIYISSHPDVVEILESLEKVPAIQHPERAEELNIGGKVVTSIPSTSVVDQADAAIFDLYRLTEQGVLERMG